MIDALLTFGHIVTFCWVLSRFLVVHHDAWKPDQLDAIAAFLAVTTWLANVLDLVVHPGETASGLSSATTIEIFVSVVAVCGLYIVLTWVSGWIRVYVGRVGF